MPEEGEKESMFSNSFNVYYSLNPFLRTKSLISCEIVLGLHRDRFLK
jgi:hypothetical protein